MFSICTSFCLSVCLSLCTSVCIPICLSICTYVCLPICLSTCTSVYLYVRLFIYLSVRLWLSVYMCLFESYTTTKGVFYENLNSNIAKKANNTHKKRRQATHTYFILSLIPRKVKINGWPHTHKKSNEVWWNHKWNLWYLWYITAPWRKGVFYETPPNRDTKSQESWQHHNTNRSITLSLISHQEKRRQSTRSMTWPTYSLAT